MAGAASPRPLRGQSFYLDLPSGRSARQLAEAIGRLGGVTESFLSKEVTCVVSSNREAKRGQARAREEKQNSPAAEGTKSTSSVPAAPKGTPARPRQKPPSTALLSRGKELLNKAMKNQVSSLGWALLGLAARGCALSCALPNLSVQDSCSGSSILANARLWGVQILHVDGILHCGVQGGCCSLGFILDHSLGEKLCQGLQAPAFPSAMGSALQSEGNSSLPWLSFGSLTSHVPEMLSYAQQLLRAISGARKQCQKTEVTTYLQPISGVQGSWAALNSSCEMPCLQIQNSQRQEPIVLLKLALVTFDCVRRFGAGSNLDGPDQDSGFQGFSLAGKLKPPFLKVEDQSRQFRPFHHQFQSFPDLNFLAPKSSSPFEPLKNFNSCQARVAEGCALHSAGGKSPHSTHVTVPRKRRGFCECCQETFEELQKHLQSPQHQRFAQDSSQYIPVDRVISQLTNSFVEWSAK
ncbi:Protein DBF4 B [Lonchura striata]|uniref:Protein DBF4 B n=1 Tax=Lonchura striata TaxID=40157 RepID=A0A218UGW0_9PASE|nr:Protein DBF4 B [Lonchura striata domestica]